jgi:hypothetical protein
MSIHSARGTVNAGEGDMPAAGLPTAITGAAEPRMDSLSAFGVFVRAAEARSFTEAGRRLSVSSSAVGKTISRLEDRLGVRLFHRNTRTITLTPEGELFL